VHVQGSAAISINRLYAIGRLVLPTIGGFLAALGLLAHALDRAHQRLLELAGRSAVEQVSHLLLHESVERDEPTLEITQEELAATLALSRQTVSRAFHDLASEGAIKPERRRVRLLDLEKLREHLPR